MGILLAYLFLALIVSFLCSLTESVLLSTPQTYLTTIKEKESYLKAYTGGYSASGLDNGARSYEVIGPIVKIVKYSEEKSNYLKGKVKEYHYRDSNNNKCILHHNLQYEVKNPGYGPVYTYGKTYSKKNDRPFAPIKKFTVCKNKPEYIGSYTVHYTSFDDNMWTTYD